ncbi:MAG: hypothetical protein K6E86_03875 [Bacteroidales bacterium]|nr:hypothetical protein [Bacteroidales bacterium]
MKRYFWTILGVAVLSVLMSTSCRQAEPKAVLPPGMVAVDSVAIDSCEVLTDSLVRRLFWSLPTYAERNAEMNHSERIAASAAAALIREAKDLVTIESPLRTAYYASSIFGEICDREKTSIDSVRIYQVSDSTLAVVYVRYCFLGYSGSREYSYLATTLNLIPSNGHWLIDDFAVGRGKFKSEVTDFIRRQRICFYSDEWREWFVKERFEGRYPRYKEKDRATSQRMLVQIDEYLQMYPDSLSVVGKMDETFIIESSDKIQRQLKASGLNEARVRALFNAIPGATSRNPKCNLSDPTKAYSKQMSALLRHAFDVPNDAFTNDGSRNQLALLVNTQEDDLVFVSATHIIPINDDFVFANLSVAHVKGFDVDLQDMCIQLVRENGQWVIADFGSSKFLMEYIARQRKFFRSEEWQQRVANERKMAAMEEDKQLRLQWQQSIEQNLKDVEVYFEKHPDR